MKSNIYPTYKNLRIYSKYMENKLTHLIEDYTNESEKLYIFCFKFVLCKYKQFCILYLYNLYDIHICLMLQ